MSGLVYPELNWYSPSDAGRRVEPKLPPAGKSNCWPSVERQVGHTLGTHDSAYARCSAFAASAAFGMHHDIRPAFHTGVNRHGGPCLGKTGR